MQIDLVKEIEDATRRWEVAAVFEVFAEEARHQAQREWIGLAAKMKRGQRQGITPEFGFFQKIAAKATENYTRENIILDFLLELQQRSIEEAPESKDQPKSMQIINDTLFAAALDVAKLFNDHCEPIEGFVVDGTRVTNATWCNNQHTLKHVLVNIAQARGKCHE